MRYVFGLVGGFALGLALMVGCSDESGEGGTGGTGGSNLCAGVICEDTECKVDGTCNPIDGLCDYTRVEDGTACSEGECLDGVCAPIGAFPCTEQGIRDAIAEGGGPHFFACDGPTTVVTEAEIAIDNDVALDGEGKLTVDGADEHAVFFVPENINAELEGFEITRGVPSRNRLPEWGGAIFNEGTLTLASSVVSQNAQAIGNLGILTVTNSAVSGNADGGVANAGLSTLTNTTVSGNAGSGIFNLGVLTLTNSTVSDNSATEFGGGLANAGGAATFANSTISRNSGAAGTGISNTPGQFGAMGTITLTNTVVEDICNGAIDVSGGGNIESPGDTCGFDEPTDQVNVTTEQLALGPLQDNGGPTETHALGAGSVAIDQIPEADCVDADGAPLTTDQRGEPRPETGGTMCDVGAFEVQP